MDQRVTFHLTTFQNCVVDLFLMNIAAVKILSTYSIYRISYVKSKV